MSYIPNFQTNYFPQYPQMQQQIVPQIMPDDRIFVQGEQAAKAYLVAPGNTVTLWDSEKQAIYRKSVNANGVPMLQRISYTYEEDGGSCDMDKRLKGIEDRLSKLEAPKEEVINE